MVDDGGDGTQRRGHLAMLARRWLNIYEECLICHSWREVVARRITAMTFFLVLSILIAVAALAPRYGADSRDLHDRCRPS
jgi:hypothetical protein